MEPDELPTLIVGTDGVTAIEGGLTFGPRIGAGGPPIEIWGIEGVTEIAGAVSLLRSAEDGVSLMAIVGIDGVTEIDGVFAPERLPAALPEGCGAS